MIPQIHPPIQFLPHRVQKTVIQQLHNLNRKIAPAYGYLVVGDDDFVAGVEGTEEVFGTAHHLEGDGGGVGDDEWSDVEVVRCHGRQHEVVGVGKNNRAAATERVAGTACRRGHHEAIGPVGIEVGPVHEGVDGNHGRSVPFEDGKVIEGKR